MANSVKDRLILFIDSKGISKNAFEKACGLSTRYVSNMRQSIQPDKIKKIALVFPELNTGWLLTGEGEMVKGKTSQSSKGDNTIQVSGTNVDMRNINQSKGSGDDAKRVKELERRIEELTKDKERLQDLVDKMQAQISKLLEKI
jgi:transcriptional regulator with XRE-family HTH domain